MGRPCLSQLLGQGAARGHHATSTFAMTAPVTRSRQRAATRQVHPTQCSGTATPPQQAIRTTTSLPLLDGGQGAQVLLRGTTQQAPHRQPGWRGLPSTSAARTAEACARTSFSATSARASRSSFSLPRRSRSPISRAPHRAPTSPSQRTSAPVSRRTCSTRIFESSFTWHHPEICNYLDVVCKEIRDSTR